MRLRAERLRLASLLSGVSDPAGKESLTVRERVTGVDESAGVEVGVVSNGRRGVGRKREEESAICRRIDQDKEEDVQDC